VGDMNIYCVVIYLILLILFFIKIKNDQVILKIYLCLWVSWIVTIYSGFLIIGYKIRIWDIITAFIPLMMLFEKYIRNGRNKFFEYFSYRDKRKLYIFFVVVMTFYIASIVAVRIIKGI
jgi:hypothetical protein